MEHPHRPYDYRRYVPSIVAVWCFPVSCILCYWGNAGISVLTYRLRLCCSVSGEICPRSQNQCPHQRNKTCETRFILDRTMFAWQKTRAGVHGQIGRVFFFRLCFIQWVLAKNVNGNVNNPGLSRVSRPGSKKNTFGSQSKRQRDEEWCIKRSLIIKNQGTLRSGGGGLEEIQKTLNHEIVAR